MADESSFGGQPDSAFGAGFSAGFGGEPAAGFGSGADVPPVSILPPRSDPAADAGESPGALRSFGQGLAKVLGAPSYRAPDPELSPLDQTADTLQQRIKRANDIAANPLLQFFSPEGVQRARDFVPAASEKLQQIRTQQAAIRAGRVQAQTLGLQPGDVTDEATMADRVEVAKARALKGDLKVFRGLQAVDPKTAEAIQDQVQEVVAGHLTKAQYAFDSLAGMQNEGQYRAKLEQLRKEGALGDLEALGLKVPASFDAFQNNKALEGKALREARMGIDTIRNKLEERNTYQPMEEKEAKTYSGRLKTVYGDDLTGVWGRNAASGTRGLIVNGAADPRDLGKKFTLATPEQRKAISEEAERAVPKDEMHKYREFNRTYELATHDGKGNPVPEGRINTNPNVQQGIAEGLASMLRGGSGGANQGLLKIELDKRGWSQQAIDGLISNYAGFMNTLFSDAKRTDKPYLSVASQKQIREVMDVLQQHNDSLIEDRIAPIAKRAGALGLDTTSFGWGKDEAAGVVGNAIRAGREEQIARMLPYHQAIGGGDGVFQLGAQRPGAGAVAQPPGTAPTTQLPGQPPVATPVQQATQPQSPAPQPTPSGVSPPGASDSGAAPPAATAPIPTGGPGSAGGGSATPAPVTIAGQQVSVPTPPGASPAYAQAAQRIESGREKDPWTAEVRAKGPDGKPLSSASGAFQFTDGTWAENKPAGAPARAKDATPAQQAEAFATLTAKNGAALQKAGIPVNDTSLYVAHNLGAMGAQKLLTADPNADAREVVGERAARNNPLFFKGRPTVAKVLERYGAEMEKGLQPTPDDGPKPKPGGGGATAEAPGLLTRISRMLMQGVPAEKRDQAAAEVGAAAVEHAPAIGSTLGAAGGAVGGPAGIVAGGAAGGGAGQALKDYLQGRDFSAGGVAKETALGGVLGVTSVARPVLATAARVAGSGAVQAGAAAVEGKSAEEIAEAGMKGAALAAGGEAFGRALGMVGHKIWNMFAPESKAAVREAAGKYATAEATLAKEAPTLPSVNGQPGGKNPAYLKAEADKMEAERVLKDAGLRPEEAAYAHKVASEGVPKQEAEAARPGKVEEQRVGAGYQQLEREIGEKGRGAVRATPKQRTALPESGSLDKPRPPTSEELATKGRVENVPLSEVRATQSRMEWDKFNRGEHPEALVKGFEDKPVAVRREDGEYLVFDGHHRTVKAMNAGKNKMEMYVIDAKAYEPTAAGRKKVSPKWTAEDDALLAELGGMEGAKAPARGPSYNPILTDGPMAAVTNKQVSAKHAEMAERTEMAITAPAANWREKWVQLKDARSALLTAERDALASTSPGKTKIAEDMRTLADSVRKQQEKAAKYVFGEKDGEAFMKRLKVLDVRYRNLMAATNGGELAAAAAMKGEAGREAERKFVAFAHDDPQAIAAYRAMRGAKGDVAEATVPWTVAAEGLPVVGKVVKVAKLGSILRDWARERAAGNPVRFEDLAKTQLGTATVNQGVRDVLGSAGARGAAM